MLLLQVGQNPLHQIVLLEQDELYEEGLLAFIILIAQQLMKLSHLLWETVSLSYVGRNVQIDTIVRSHYDVVHEVAQGKILSREPNLNIEFGLFQFHLIDPREAGLQSFDQPSIELVVHLEDAATDRVMDVVEVELLDLRATFALSTMIPEFLLEGNPSESPDIANN